MSPSTPHLARAALTAGALLLAAPLTADAVHGDGPVRVIEGERTWRTEEPARQRVWSQQPAWQEFLSRRGGQWTARWDDTTGTPVRFYGTGWDVDAELLASDEGAFALAEQILREEAGLLGRDVDPRDLRRGVVDRTAGITTVTFQQTWQGLRVDETRLSLRFKAGRFAMGQVETLPVLADVPTSPTLSKDDALAVSLDHLGWPDVDTVYSAELVVLPIRGRRVLDARLAWRFDLTRAGSHPFVWVDAVTGEYLGFEQQVRNATGTVLGELDDRWPENGLAEVPMTLLPVEGESGTDVTDSAGGFSLPGGTPDTITAEVGSVHFDISNQGGDTLFAAFLQSDGGDVLFVPDPGAGNGAQRRQRAELDIHYSALVSRAKAVEINPNFSWAQVEAEVNVNRTEACGGATECNACFDPSNSPSNSAMYFIRQGGGCNNTARIWDVMFHEYGHGFHIWNIIFGAGDFDGPLSEGLSDYMSATITNDAAMGPGFVLGNSDPLRNLAPNRVWPDDITQAPHGTGLIVGGALWDVRNALEAEQGAAGVTHADQIFLAVAQRASDVPTSYEEALLADDDNGNLADGTPNRCLIDEQFALHGLGPGVDGGALYATEFTPVSALIPGETTPLDLRASITNAQCADGDIAAVRLLWSADASATVDAFESSEFVSVSDEDWSATLPAAEDGTYVRYRVELVDSSGATVVGLPRGAVSDPWYAAWAGGEVVWEDDVESGEGDFTSSLIQGGDQEGANDWMVEVPKGGGGDPLTAASGSFAWGNDLEPQQNWNGEYQNEIHNVLRSGPIQVGDDGAHLQFRRWLTVEDGFWDQAWIEVNGALVWENFASPNQNDAQSHHIDTEWMFRSYDVTDLVEDGVIEIEWHLQSDQGLTFGGWTLDDFRVVAAEGGGVIVGPGDDDDASDDDDGPGGRGSGFSGTGGGCACDTTSPGRAPWLALLVLGFGVVGRRRR